MSELNSLKRVKYDVPLYRQGWTNLCWAHCQVMVECFENNTRLTQKQARERAKQLSMEKYGELVGGTPTNAAKGIKINTIEDLYNILIEQKGPVYADYFSRKSNGGHLVVVTGVDVSSNTVYTNNPDGFFGLALKGAQDFNKFLNSVVTFFIYGWFSNLYLNEIVPIKG